VVTFSVGSTSARANGAPILRMGDQGTCTTCGSVTINNGSSKSFNEGKAIARVGDGIVGGGTGVITSVGSPSNVNVN